MQIKTEFMKCSSEEKVDMGVGCSEYVMGIVYLTIVASWSTSENDYMLFVEINLRSSD